MKNSKGVSFIAIGLLLILGAVILTGYNVYDAKRAEKAAQIAVSEMNEYLSEKREEVENYTRYEEVEFIPDYVLYPEMEMPVKDIDGGKYVGVIEIPSLNVSLPVMSEMTNSNLKISPCRYAGTAYLDGFVIGAHNYRSHFADLKLLQNGDRIIFHDNAGNTFNYMVLFTENLEPAQVEEMKTDEWSLTLFTCTPGGQYRVTVRCEKIEE